MDLINEKQDAARLDCCEWCMHSKSRVGYLFAEMCRTRAQLSMHLDIVKEQMRSKQINAHHLLINMIQRGSGNISILLVITMLRTVLTMLMVSQML